uniref:MULE transposase domain-containing protein n=1 Tax=Cannabis sativa TaxID=3483 RepID=A0A803PTQ8_CANSA
MPKLSEFSSPIHSQIIAIHNISFQLLLLEKPLFLDLENLRSTSTYNELGIELGQAEEGTSNSDEEATVDMDADESENYISNASWKLRASRNGNTMQFIIMTFEDNHSCDMKIRLKDQRQATSTIIQDMIKYKFTNIKTKTTVADVINELKIRGLRVKYSKAWRSIQKAKEKVRGNVVKSYSEIAKYLYLLHHTNPVSFVELKTEEDGFLFLFVALNASRKGWLHCIPVVIVDGTFLKSTYGVILLVAATQDAEAAKAYTVKGFERHMGKLDKIDKRLRPYLQEIGKGATNLHYGRMFKKFGARMEL